MLNVLDLFSGIGGFSLGLERTGGFCTRAFCEIDPYCQRVLKRHWPRTWQFDDVRKLNRRALFTRGVRSIDLICGGFPCQPFSLAGRRLGSEDDRHLWPEYRRLIEELRPAWVIGENVVGLVGMGLDAVIDDLEALGYSTRTFDIPACSVGARHARRRIWIVAHANKQGLQRQPSTEVQGRRVATGHLGASCADVADAEGIGRDVSPAAGPGEHQGERTLQAGGRGFLEGVATGKWWDVEPDVGRVAHGVPSRVDRIRALGNAVVPQIAEVIGRAILKAEGVT